MIDPKTLLADLKKQVKALEADLRLNGITNGTTAAELEREWRAARDAQRTAATFDAWRKDRVTQVAVAWVLGTVFVRFCEDNDLIEYPVIAGPGDRIAVTRERQAEFFEESPELTDRDWIIEGFNALSLSPVAAGLFESHNPMWTIYPSHEAAKALLAFWRDQDADAQIIHDFTDETWNTRFLGDLYQYLSVEAQKTYALLQTPEFVEEFILKYTMDPAITEFGLEPEPSHGHPDLPRRLRVIDPACGSGHFLLGAFQRLLGAWHVQSADTDKWELIARTLESVHGVDKNPFAVAITRFRLMLAAMKAGEVNRLTERVDFSLKVAVGDSLIHGRGAIGTQGELFGVPYTYRTEDIGIYIKSIDMLGVGSYHAVFGNPPYITVKDKKENENYRKAYPSCAGKYALSVPFAERFFQLAIPGSRDRLGSGYVGQITANSFMKREFGKKIIEEFFQRVDLTHIIDTSGAHIPGHGTPTVILFGRRRWPRQDSTCRAVLGVSGEPGVPENPASGHVWQSIVNQIDRPGSDSEWVSVTNISRDRLSVHPWSLSGGGAGDLFKHLEDAAKQRIGDRLSGSAGFAGFSANDEAFDFSNSWHLRHKTPPVFVRPLVAGKDIKSWSFEPQVWTLAPYDEGGKLVSIDTSQPWARQLWMAKRCMEELSDFSGRSRRESGIPYWSWYHWVASRNDGGDRIVVAKIATHNDAAINRGRAITNQHVFVLQLESTNQADASSAMLALLNSSTACFWLKQVSHDRGNRGGERSTARYAWESFFELTAAKLERFPLPADLPLEFGRELDRLALELSALEPLAVCADDVPARDRLDAARREHDRIRGRMIALQEELDWSVYRRYGLLDEAEASGLTAKPDRMPELRLGERAFEILMARRMKDSEADTQWFARHGSIPIAEIPAGWPQEYRDVVARRIETIERRRDLGLIERPECKRRWQSEPWEKKEQAALRTWLLDRCEGRDLWYVADHQGNFQPRVMTVHRLADRLRGDADMVSVARLYGGPDADLADVLTQIIANEHVPFLSQLRYSGTGLLTRLLWEKTWDLQREEDRTGQRLDIDVPEKYKKEDFLRTSYWNQRGKFDVPRERFVSYRGASPNSDDSLLLGWAGWDHREQALALITLIEERSGTDGWGVEKLIPLLAGLLEVMPWVRQWHNEVDDNFGASPSYEYDTYLTSQRERYGLTEDDLRAWAPPKAARGRRRNS